MVQERAWTLGITKTQRKAWTLKTTKTQGWHYEIMEMNERIQKQKMTPQEHGDKLKSSRTKDDTTRPWRWTKSLKM